MKSVLLTQTHISAGSVGGETDIMLTLLASDILQKLPPPFDSEKVAKKYPVLYAQSMNTVLRQVEYNRINNFR